MRIAETEVPSEWTTKVSCTFSPNTVASTPRGPKSTSPIQSAELSPSTAASRSSVVQVPSGWPTRTVVDSAPEIATRSEEHTSELQSLMRISYAVFCLKKKKKKSKKELNDTAETKAISSKL